MKQSRHKNFIILITILLTVLFTSFSPNSKKEETTLRNIEALSNGENPSYSSCVNGEGRCIENGHALFGIRIKQ